MAARPRIKKRANWPDHLHEPRPGYFTWRDPRDGKTHILGRMSLAQARHEADEANRVVERSKITRTLAERLEAPTHTVSDLIDKMTSDGLKPNTIKARSDYDRVIKAKIGEKECRSITTVEVSDILEEIKSRGKSRWAQAIRTRMIAVFGKGVALGWMDKNPALVTEKVASKVQRKRLTLEQFNLILERAPEIAPWLQNAMLLALVSGQDRSTIGAWPRNAVKDGEAVVRRTKTEKSIAIPVELRMNAIGLSLAEVIARCKSTGIVSKYLIHHTENHGLTKCGAPVHIDSISNMFRSARRLTDIPEEHAPTFHEIRSLTKRLYLDQGGVDTKALLGHSTDRTADIYADGRGIAPIKVKIWAA